ncbi:MAG: DNA cytosine methyltransferase [Chitinophagales bacterium]
MNIITKAVANSAAAIFDYILAIIGCAQPTCITLFAGVGGSSVGAHLAGFTELLATDFDPVSALNFANYFKDDRYVPYWVADIWDISPLDILQRTMLDVGQLCLLLITSPCQGFSEASGKFNPLDPRNALFLRAIDFVKAIKPMVAVFENVPGMLSPNLTPIMNEIKLRLKEEIPEYRVFCFKFNSLFYGVPSDRLRLIFFCIRLDIFRKVPVIAPVTPNIGDYAIANIAPAIQQIQFGQSKKIIRFPHEFMPTITATEGIKYREDGKWYKLGENETYLRKFQSFPDDFVLSGTPKQNCKMIGNSVPPNMMANILRYVKHEILCFPYDIPVSDYQTIESHTLLPTQPAG